MCGFAFGVLIDIFLFCEYVLGLMGSDDDGDGGMWTMMVMMVVVMGVFCFPVVSEESHQKRRILVCRETKALLLC